MRLADRLRIACLSAALAGLATLPMRASAQSTITGVSSSVAVTTPTGTEFEAGATVAATLTFNVDCPSAVGKCGVYVALIGTAAKPTNAKTVLQYRQPNGQYADVPTLANIPTGNGTAVCAFNKGVSGTCTVNFRYPLSWALADASYAPPSTATPYSTPIQIVLKQNLGGNP